MATPEETEGQALRTMTFNYWLVPLAGPPDRTLLCTWGQQILSGIRTVTLQSADGRLYRQPTSLPTQASFLHVSGTAVVTSLRDVDGAVELRLFNPETEAAEIEMGWAERPLSMPTITHIQRVNLESTPLAKPTPVTGPAAKLTVMPKEIVTLRLLTDAVKG